MTESRVAVVTGAALGIGKAIAAKFLQEGYRTFALDLDAQSLAETSLELSNAGEFFTESFDATDEGSVAECFESILSRAGRIDILVNNAGGSGAVSQSIEEISLKDWERVVNFNLKSTFLCIKAVVPSMKKTGWGRIVNMASMAGRSRSIFGGAPYAASKAAVIGLTRQTSKDLGPFGITINAVAPGLIISGARIEDYWNNKKTPEERNDVLSRTPMRRPGTPSDIAAMVAYLVSEDASFVTGSVFDVNGGFWVG